MSRLGISKILHRVGPVPFTEFGVQGRSASSSSWQKARSRAGRAGPNAFLEQADPVILADALRVGALSSLISNFYGSLD